MLRRSCGVRYDERVRPLREGRVGLWLGACLVVAVLTVADRLHARPLHCRTWVLRADRRLLDPTNTDCERQ